jgi:type VI secretion system secreted protein VgrG
MGVTVIDVQLTENIVPVAFNEAERLNFSWDSLGADRLTPLTATLFGLQQKWLVARVHLVERLGELYRCELILTRIEGFADDPSITKPGTGWFDRLADRFDDGSRSDTLQGSPNQQDDLRSATDRLRNQSLLTPGAGPATPFGSLPGIGGLPGALADTAANFGSIAMDQFNDTPTSIDDLFGIPTNSWNPELAPSPAAFLMGFRSVLIRRMGAGGTTPLHGRWVSGVITEYEDLGVFGSNRRAVKIVIEPQLAILGLRKNHRIFTGLTAMEIVKQLFGEAGIYGTNFEAPASNANGAPFVARPYCIQYGETDLEFVLRLLSEEGLIAVWEHHRAAERLKFVTPEDLAGGLGVLGTSALTGAPQTLDADDLLRDGITADGPPAASSIDERMWNLALRRNVRPVASSLRSTDFSKYGTVPLHIAENVASKAAPIDEFFTSSQTAEPTYHEFPARTVFEFDGQNGTQTDRVDLAREAALELMAIRSTTLRGRGASNAVALSAGHRIGVSDALNRGDIYDDETRPYNRNFVLVAVEAMIETGNAALGPNPTLWYLPTRPRPFSPTDAIDFLSYVDVVPEDQLYVPPRRRAPIVDGVQTAITKQSPTTWKEGMSRVGVDVIGRVQARLHWDRRPDEDPQTNQQPLSPPIRVSSTWAGYAWGTTFLPREGMELLLAFQHGDPTQPIAIGAVHGAVNHAPCDRPHIPLYDDAGPGDLHPTNDKVRKDKILHYVKDHEIKPSGTQHINMIRTQVDPPEQADRKLGYHELSFDDTPKKERVRLHSEGLLTKEVMNDHRTLAVRDQMNIVQDQQKEKIHGNQKLVVHGTRTKEVIGNELLEVAEDQKITVTGHSRLEVNGKLVRKITADETIVVGKPAPGVARMITIDKGRKTAVGGNDVRNVKGMVKEDIGGCYELSGAPLDMKQTAPPTAAPGAPQKGITANENGDLTFEAGDGQADLIADGDVIIKTGGVHLWGTTAVRLEAGDDVWVELTPDEIKMNAPKGVDMHCATADGETVGVITLLNVDGGGEITMKLDVGTQDEKGHYRAVLRGGDSPETEDPLEGKPGWKINTDSIEIKGGFASLESPMIEIQNGEGPLSTHRTLSEEEKSLRDELPELRKKVDEQEAVVADAVQAREDARVRYQEAAKKRKAVQEKIESTEGKDSDLADAIDDVEAAEREVAAKEAALEAARKEYDRAEKAGEDTSDAKDAWEDAEEELEEAKEDLKSEEEDLEDEREEHGELVQEYEDARNEENNASEALTSAQTKVQYEQQKLEKLQRELRAKEAEANALGVPPKEEEQAPASTTQSPEAPL